MTSVRFVKKSSEGRAPKAPRGRDVEKGYPSSQKILDFFHIKIVHSGAFSYTNSKVLFAIKCRERYVITRYSWRLTVIQTWKQVFINLVNLYPSSQSVATLIGFTATVRMCYAPKIILYELQTQATLSRATVGPWCEHMRTTEPQTQP